MSLAADTCPRRAPYSRPKIPAHYEGDDRVGRYGTTPSAPHRASRGARIGFKATGGGANYYCGGSGRERRLPGLLASRTTRQAATDPGMRPGAFNVVQIADVNGDQHASKICVISPSDSPNLVKIPNDKVAEHPAALSSRGALRREPSQVPCIFSTAGWNSPACMCSPPTPRSCRSPSGGLRLLAGFKRVAIDLPP